jgi:hypothetical protein
MFLYKGFDKRYIKTSFKCKLFFSYELLSLVLIRLLLILMDSAVPLVLQCLVSVQSNKYIFTFIHMEDNGL